MSGSSLLVVPDTEEDVPVRIHPQHDVLHRGVVDERAFGVDEEDVRNPDFLHKPGVKGPALVVLGREGQALIFPVVTQVESHGEVLQVNTSWFHPQTEIQRFPNKRQRRIRN